MKNGDAVHILERAIEWLPENVNGHRLGRTEKVALASGILDKSPKTIYAILQGERSCTINFEQFRDLLKHADPGKAQEVRKFLRNYFLDIFVALEKSARLHASDARAALKTVKDAQLDMFQLGTFEKE